MRDTFNGVYRGKKVLITGYTGFKGSWLTLWLKELGASVRGYALKPYTELDNFALSGLADKVTGRYADIRDFSKLMEVFQEYQPEIVFHLAAQPLVRLSYEIPKETYDINVGGTVNLLEAVRLTGSVKVVINITSDKCYENQEWVWGYRENDPMGGYDPYSSSKGCAELVIAAYRNSFFNPRHNQSDKKSISSARAGNVIGGGDWAKDRIVPDCVRALLARKPIDIRNPQATRPWQHVLEPLSGYLWLGALMYEAHDREDADVNYCGAWNFGPDADAALPVAELVEYMLKYWGSGEWRDISGGDKKNLHEASFLSLDCSKARKYLGWKPSLDIEQAIELTVEWYQKFKETNVYDLCLSQIEKYTNIAKSKKLPWS